MRIELKPCRRELWQHFQDYHYFANTNLSKLNKSCKALLVLVDGQPLAFCAALPLRSGTVKNGYWAHKTVVRMAESDVEKEIWKTASDAEAQWYVAQGKRFFSTAPTRYAAYRDDVGSGWRKTSRYHKNKVKGYLCHEYVG